MFILIVAITALSLFCIVKGIRLFNHYCQRRLGYCFFTAHGFWLAAIGINCIWWGLYFWATAPLRGLPPAGGLILMAFGLAAVARLIYENIQNVGLLYGAGGSSLQLVLFFPAALFVVPCLVVAMFFLIYGLYKGGSVWFVDS
jgi:hypothetical protein